MTVYPSGHIVAIAEAKIKQKINLLKTMYFMVHKIFFLNFN